MGKLNTTQIGDDFELRSLDIIRNVIDNGQLGHLAECLKIIPKATYYSSRRKKEVTFDLSIEVWPPGAKRYVMAYIIECKNYKKRVSVDKINTFLFDINEIGLVNVKGIFITNSPLQEAAYNVAESAGMMVIQGESSEDYKILLHKSNRNIESGKIPFITELLKQELMDTGVELFEKLIDREILNALSENITQSRVSYGIDRLSKESIETIANEELNKLNPDILVKARIIGPATLKRYLNEAHELKIVEVESEDNVLGSCNISENTIYLNKTIVGSNREFFILAHEFGHFILHQKLSIGQIAYDAFEDSEYSFRSGKYDLANPKNWIEWQANYFASSIVLPTISFFTHLCLIQDSLNKSRGIIYLDEQYRNIKDFNEIVRRLAYRFSVSKTSVIYKLNDMRLINNQSRIKTVGQIIKEFNELSLI